MSHRGVVASAIAIIAGAVVAAMFIGPRLRPIPSPRGADATKEASGASASPGKEAKAGGPERTEAVRIIGLRRLLDADRQWRTSFEEESSRLTGQFDQVSNNFESIDERLKQERERRARSPEKPTAKGAPDALAAIEADWVKARDDLDKQMARRKVLGRQIQTIAEKITLMEGVLARLTGVDPPDPGGEARDPSAPAPAKPAPVAQGGAAAGGPPQGPEAHPEAAEPAEEELVEARRQLASKQAAWGDAGRRVERLDRGIDVIGRDMESTREMLTAARQDLKAAEESLRSIEANRGRVGPAGAALVGPPDLRRLREEGDRRIQLARVEAEDQAGRLAESEALLERLRSDRDQAARVADEAGSAAEASKALVRFLDSPIAPHRMLRWLTGQAPRVLGVVLVMLAAWWLSRYAAHRIMAGLVRRGRRDTAAEREERAETLRRVFTSATGLAIAVVGGLAVLDQAGVNISVLLGGAAVMGAAIAFGTQNLIKDYFSGFMILVENQYSVGNVITIGEITGTVEDISLRMTVLRDIEGVVHFIPHGQVTRVSNMTHGWSNVVLSIGVGFSEDLDRVMELLLGLARDLAAEEKFRDQIVGEPEMLGVDSMSGSGIVIKFRMKTRPHMRWQVKREMLKRIKNRFEKENINVH